MSESLEGWVPEIASHDDLLDALEKAFGYRGDVTLELHGGTRVTGYVFNRRFDVPEPFIDYYAEGDDAPAVRLPCADIASLTFTGRDTADGRSWEAWVARHEQERSG